ncbi:MAG: hemolysin family protein [Clostridiales bacterium]|nr:hemolysin family protein [Clostridiales bacterium]
MLAELGILFILMLLNGMLAAAEIAIISVNQNRLRKRSDRVEKKVILLRAMTENPSGFLATIQIGISIIALFSGAFAAQSFGSELADLIVSAKLPFSRAFVDKISVLVITLMLSYFNLVFAELVPKKLAMKKSEPIALAMVMPVHALSVFAKPIVKLLSASTNVITKLFGVEDDQTEGDVTEEEIRLMIDAGGDTGAIDENEMEMINNVFEFDDKTAEDICTHRMDIVAFSVDADKDVILSILEAEKFTRYPVYEDTIDNIIGILHIKDLMKYIIHNNLHEVDLREILRKPHFVPFSVKTDELFEYMQKNMQHVAIVLDEYGGTLGIVTMEDLIEEVMGNIWDEYDEEEKDIVAIDENTFNVSGSAELSEVGQFFDVMLPTDDYITLGGFIISQLGRIPDEDEKPEIEFNGLLFKVKSVEDKRIDEVIICKAT